MIECTLVLFDLDGVLIDTTTVLKNCYKEIGRIAGSPIQSEEQLRSLVRMSPKTAIRNFNGGNIDLVNAFDQLWNKQARLASPFPGISNLLDQLSWRNIDLGVVTSRNKTDTTILLGASHLSDRMRTIITWGNYRIAKPSPICILTALEESRSQPNHAIYVGDQDKDMKAARSAGVSAIGAAWDQYANSEELIQAGAQLIAKTPSEVLDFVIR